MNKCTRCGTQFEPDGVCQSSLCDPCKYAVNPPAGVNRTNPITIAREQGRKAGLSSTLHLGCNPFLAGQRPAEHQAWEEGYNEVQQPRPVTAYDAKIRAALDGPPHGGRELE